MARKRLRTSHANDNDETRPADRNACDHAAGDSAATEPEIAALDFASQLFVWGVRSWVQALKARQDFSHVTGNAFVRFDLARSATALDDLMTTIAASATRMIDVRCIRCPALSPDEAILIDALIAAQRAEYFLATLVLRKLLPGTAARIALPHLVDLARDLVRSGMILRATSAMSSELQGGAAIGAARLH